MKLAVIFLCLSVASLFGTSKGEEAALIGGKVPSSFNGMDLSYMLNVMVQITLNIKFEKSYKGCDTSVILQLRAEILINFLFTFAHRCGQDIYSLLSALGCTVEEIRAIMGHDCAHLGELIKNNKSSFLSNVIIMVQGVFAKCGCCLHNEIAAVLIVLKLDVVVEQLTIYFPVLVIDITVVSTTLTSAIANIVLNVNCIVVGTLQPLVNSVLSLISGVLTL